MSVLFYIKKNADIFWSRGQYKSSSPQGGLREVDPQAGGKLWSVFHFGLYLDIEHVFSPKVKSSP